jgi:hypothetical protein
VPTGAAGDPGAAGRGYRGRRDAAFASGAQLVSTDFYLPAPFGNDYRVTLPGGGAGRCNPLLVEGGCVLEPAAQD